MVTVLFVLFLSNRSSASGPNRGPIRAPFCCDHNTILIVYYGLFNIRHTLFLPLAGQPLVSKVVPLSELAGCTAGYAKHGRPEQRLDIYVCSRFTESASLSKRDTFVPFSQTSSQCRHIGPCLIRLACRKLAPSHFGTFSLAAKIRVVT